MTTGRWMQGTPRKILLATDLSARCDRAFDRAASLAAEWNAELVAVHVLQDVTTFVPGGSDVMSSWRRPPNARHLAESRMRDDLQALYPRLDIVVEIGDPAEAILRTARAQDCDLIVTGVAREELLGRIVLGNTVIRLARQSEIPILVVRKRGRRPYGNIVLATDFSDSSRHALEVAERYFPNRTLTLFNAYDAPLSLMAADTVSHRAQFREAAEREGRMFLRTAGLADRPGGKAALVLEHGDPDQRLYEYVTRNDIDLVALGTHGRSAVFHALIGSVARTLIETLPCDGLIVREPLANAGA